MSKMLGMSAAMVHMENGGQVYRILPRDRFFYKIEGGVLLCRCNELGGWHPSSAPLRDSDELYVATVDWHSSAFPDRVWTTPLPLPNAEDEVRAEFRDWWSKNGDKLWDIRESVKVVACLAFEAGRNLAKAEDTASEGIREITLSEAKELVTESSYVMASDVGRLAVLVTIEGNSTLQLLADGTGTGNEAIAEYLASVCETDSSGCEAVRIVAG